MINIAIDGPSGAGKSTVARGAAKALSYVYVDTGALYRSIALNVIRHGIDTKDAEKIEKLLDQTKVELKYVDSEQQVFLNGENVSSLIRTPEASMGASDVSAIPAVRSFLLQLQRDIADKNNCIMDGRDIGTVVLPNAKIKVFLTASVECRAKRRHKELVEKGQSVSYDDVYKDIEQRDYNDSHREIAPLKPSEDSILFDSTDCTLEQSIQKLLTIIKEHS